MARSQQPRVGKKDNYPSLRLMFSYEGFEVQLDSVQKVYIISPPSDWLEPNEGEPGFWYELRDNEGQTIYRRVTTNPIKFQVEVRTEDENRPLAWVKAEEPKGVFVLLVPDLLDSEDLVLVSSPIDEGSPIEPAKEVARFNLKEHKDKEVT
jgi:hypothetical protein